MYSQDFRQRVISALGKGLSIRKVADVFGISKGTVQNWKRCPKPKKNNAGRPPKIDAQALIRDVEMYPDAYQQERAERFNCSRSAISECLKRLNISKKNSPPSQSISCETFSVSRGAKKVQK